MAGLGQNIIDFFKALSMRDDVLVELSQKGRKLPAKKLAWAKDGFPEEISDLYAAVNGCDLRWRFIDDAALGLLHLPEWNRVCFLEVGEEIPLEAFRSWKPRFKVRREQSQLVVVGPSGEPIGSLADYVEGQLAGRLMLLGETLVDRSERLATAARRKKVKPGARVVLHGGDAEWFRGTAVELAKANNKKAYVLVDLDAGERVWLNAKKLSSLTVTDTFEQLRESDILGIPAADRLEALACLAGSSWQGLLFEGTVPPPEDPAEDPVQHATNLGLLPALRPHSAVLLAQLEPAGAVEWVVDAITCCPNRSAKVQLGSRVAVDEFHTDEAGLANVAKSLLGGLLVRLVGEPLPDLSALMPLIEDDQLRRVFERLPSATRAMGHGLPQDEQAARELGLEPVAPLPQRFG